MELWGIPREGGVLGKNILTGEENCRESYRRNGLGLETSSMLIEAPGMKTFVKEIVKRSTSKPGFEKQY